MPEQALYQALIRPILTERSTKLKDEHNQYFFETDVHANKPGIKKAVEEIFKVKVKKVRTMIMPGKSRRLGQSAGLRPDWKKAIVTLHEGQKIDFAQETA